MNWKINEVNPHGGNRHLKDGLCSVSLNSSGQAKTNVCRISISQDAMRAMRWVRGDRVNICYDTESRMILVVRSNTGRLTLNSHSKARGNNTEIDGMCQTLIQAAACSELAGILPRPSKRCKWQPSDDGLVIKL